jgi:hypothetical protein
MGLTGIFREDAKMGAMHQLISASVAAAFSIGMMLAAHVFTEYRSSQQTLTTVIPSRQAVSTAAVLREAAE